MLQAELKLAFVQRAQNRQIKIVHNHENLVSQDFYFASTKLNDKIYHSFIMLLRGDDMAQSNFFLGKLVPTVKKITEKGIDILAVILFSTLFLFGILQVFFRWVLNNPLVWSEEAIQLMYVWICYLGWAIAERKDSHIRITAVMNALPEKGQKWLQIFNHILCIVFSVLMVYYGIKLVGVGAKRTAVSFKLNYGVVYLMGPISNFIIIFYELAGLIECFTKGPRNYRDREAMKNDCRTDCIPGSFVHRHSALCGSGSFLIPLHLYDGDEADRRAAAYYPGGQLLHDDCSAVLHPDGESHEYRRCYA